MDDRSPLEVRRDACVANLRRALQRPVPADLPAAFADALGRLAERHAAAGLAPQRERAEA